jgi:outer membrane protein assembly factor BamA
MNFYLGGNQFFTSTLGYGSSFLFDEKDNINIKLFLTSGSIGNSDYSSNNDFDIRSSAGFSLDFITAVGPISFTHMLTYY